MSAMKEPDTAADIAGSSHEEEADFRHFLLSCCAKDPSVASDTTEIRSLEDYPDVAHALTTRKVIYRVRMETRCR